MKSFKWGVSLFLVYALVSLIYTAFSLIKSIIYYII